MTTTMFKLGIKSVKATNRRLGISTGATYLLTFGCGCKAELCGGEIRSVRHGGARSYMDAHAIERTFKGHLEHGSHKAYRVAMARATVERKRDELAEARAYLAKVEATKGDE